MSNDASRRDRDAAALQKFSVEDLTEASIRKTLRSEALQHPATLIPLGLAGLSLIQLIGISPFPIGALGAIVLLVGSLSLAR